MIRHVLLLRLNDRATPESVARMRTALAALDAPGRTAFSLGSDLGLRPGTMDVAMVADFADVDAFRAYQADPEHLRIREELIVPVTERSESCQFKA